MDFNGGIGIPIFSYNYPLPNYVASLLHTIGFSFIQSFSVSMILASAIGAVGMYLLGRQLTNRFGGFVASMIYTYAPYRLVDVYVRGSIGEVWALAIAPYLFLGLTGVTKHHGMKSVSIGSISLALLVLSHNILGLFFTGLAVLYTLYILGVYRRLHHFLYVCALFTLGIGMSAVFWMPSLMEKGYVVGLQIYSVTSHFGELYQLLFPSWGNGLFTDSVNGMSIQIGTVLIAVLIGSVIWLLIHKTIEAAWVWWIIVAVVSIVMILPYSRIVWETIPLIGYTQFPWRLLSITIFAIAICSAYLCSRIRYLWGVVIVLAAMVSISHAVVPAYYYDRDDQYYLAGPGYNAVEGTNSSGNAFQTKWITQLPQRADERISVVEGEGSVAFGTQSPTQRTLIVDAVDELIVDLPIAYFPGWVLEMQEGYRDVTPSPAGRIRVTLPQGNYTASVLLRPTFVQTIAGIISMLSLSVLIFLCAKSWYHWKYASRT